MGKSAVPAAKIGNRGDFRFKREDLDRSRLLPRVVGRLTGDRPTDRATRVDRYLAAGLSAWV